MRLEKVGRCKVGCGGRLGASTRRVRSHTNVSSLWVLHDYWHLQPNSNLGAAALYSLETMTTWLPTHQLTPRCPLITSLVRSKCLLSPMAQTSTKMLRLFQENWHTSIAKCHKSCRCGNRLADAETALSWEKKYTISWGKQGRSSSGRRWTWSWCNDGSEVSFLYVYMPKATIKAQSTTTFSSPLQSSLHNNTPLKTSRTHSQSSWLAFSPSSEYWPKIPHDLFQMPHQSVVLVRF